MNVYIVGAGGVGSWLCATLHRLLNGKAALTVIDGDTLEEKNLDRQLFRPDMVGQNKSQALAGLYGIQSMPKFYSYGLIAHRPTDWIFGCVDNNAGRREILEACDRFSCCAIFAANETTSAESYLYLPSFAGSQNDPRVMYPEILTDRANDPRARAIGCTGQAQENNRQLVSANFMAAALAQHLFVFWALEYPLIEGQRQTIIPHCPHKLAANLTALNSHNVTVTPP